MSFNGGLVELISPNVSNFQPNRKDSPHSQQTATDLSQFSRFYLKTQDLDQS